MLIIRSICLVLFSLAILAPLSAVAEPIETIAKQAFIIDDQTGAVLLEKNADERMPTSSMSKVITMAAVFEALKEGRLHLDDTLPVSEEAWRKGGSKMFVEVGKRVKVEDLIRGVLIQSGNDATIVLAEGLAGTEEAFAGYLNKLAERFGMSNSHFANASGWPDPNHYSTARDLTRLAQVTIHEYPQYYPYYSELEFTYHDIKQGNRNPLLYKNIGADGVKTGHTEDGGYGLIGSAVQDGRRVILVVNGLTSMKERSSESERLMKWALYNFENKTAFKAGETVGQADVVMGKSKTLDLVSANDIVLTLPKLGADEVKLSLHYNSPLIAPIQKGEKVAVLKVEAPNMQAVEYPLQAGQDVSELGFFMKAIEKAKILLWGQ
ncbi:MAG: D-alanyl-D-alanine carboxypeptidase [Alphaproteobacteria bacterium]|nr:D-alanyl-D-alanine carboxypeptidase [Alphaproteobacteria bacterium]